MIQHSTEIGTLWAWNDPSIDWTISASEMLRDYNLDIPFVPRFVLDVGANIGAFMKFTLDRFPTAKMLCVEPSVDCFVQLLMNASGRSNVRCVRSAAGDAERQVSLVNPTGYPTTASVILSTSGKDRVRMCTIDTMLSELGWGYPDVVKIDCEGSETLILSIKERWQRDVRYLMVEVHHDLTSGTFGYRKVIADTFPHLRIVRLVHARRTTVVHALER